MHDLVDNAECPGCGARSTLDPEHTYPNARSCGACTGWFLERDTAYRFLVEDLGTSSAAIARLLASPGARERTCPACDRGMSAIVILGDDVDLCASCGGAWLGPGVMARLSRGRYGSAGAATAAVTTSAQRGAPSTGAVAAGPPAAPPSPFGLPTGERPASPFGPPRASAQLAATTTEMPRAITFPSSDGAPLGSATLEAGPAATPPAALDLARPLRGASASAIDDEVTEPRRRRVRRPNAAAPVVKVGKSVPSGAASNAPFEATSLGSVAADAGWRSKLPWIAGGAAVVVLSLGAWSLFGGEDEAASTKVAPAVDAAQKYASYLRHYRFGGRNLDWWCERLSALSPGGSAPDQKTFAITKDRAQRLGLVVNEQPGRVEVTLSEPLTARLLDRLEVE